MCLLSVAWGIIGWLYWQDGNNVNNIYVTMILGSASSGR